MRHPHSRVFRHAPARDVQLNKAIRQASTSASLGAPLGGSWSSIGPQPITGDESYGGSSGRIAALAVDPTNSAVVYAGAAGGGIWKTTNGGASWTPLTDNQLTLAIGALAIDPRAPQTIYAGTGEGNHCGDCLPSQGVLRSTDGGISWTLLAQPFFTASRFTFAGLVVDAVNGNVLAATNRGLYVSSDGGLTWTQRLAGGVDAIVQDPSTPSTYWASVADWCRSETGAIEQSTDSGNTWSVLLVPALPAPASRIALGVGKGGAAYAAVAACNSFNPSYAMGQLEEVLKTSDRGSSWAVLMPGSALPSLVDYFAEPPPPPIEYQGWYDNTVAVDPSNANNVVFGGMTMLVTSDGGQSFRDVAQPYSNGPLHPDFHAVAFSGPGSFYVGNDGGVFKTVTAMGGSGASADWQNLSGGLDVTQFYAGSALDTGHLLGGTQDTGTPGVMSGTAPGAATPWVNELGGDGGWTALLSGSNIAFGEQTQLDILQIDTTNPQRPVDTLAGPCNNPSLDPACNDPTSFIAPFVLDRSSTTPSAASLYGGTNRVWRSSSGGLPAGTAASGGSWSAISTDLTAGTAYGPRPDTIATMASGSGAASATVLTGSEFGKVFMTTNARASAPVWVDITGNLPSYSAALDSGNSWITAIAVNPTNSQEVWVTLGSLSNTGRVWHTANASASPTSWTDVTGTGAVALPGGLIIDAIALDPVTPSTVYLGTDAGALACTTACDSSAAVWLPLGSGLPNSRVDAIAITQDQAHSKLVAWTHGRGAWWMDRPSSLVPTPTPTPTASSQPGGQYHPLPPKRIADTRDGTGGVPAIPLGPGGTLEIAVTGQGGVPPSGVAAVTLNVAVTDATTDGYLTVYPGGASRPLASSINWAAGTTLSDLVEVAVGPNGTIVVYNAAGNVDVVLDVQGWTASSTNAVGMDGLYRPTTPARIFDSRNGSGSVGPGQSVTISTVGVGGLPVVGAEAVVLNVTATNGTQSSYLTVYPTGSQPPVAANLNFAAGATIGNRVMAKLWSGGQVTILNGAGSVDIVVDAVGWYTDGTALSGAGRMSVVAPNRIIDSRSGLGMPRGQLSGGATVTVEVAGRGGVPAMNSATPPRAVIISLTVTNGTSDSYLTVYPGSGSRPLVSDLNWSAGSTRNNLVVAQLAPDGTLTLYNAAGSVDVIGDVAGWYSS